MGEWKALLGVQSSLESVRSGWENKITLLIKKMNTEKWLKSHRRTDKSKTGNDDTMKILQQAAALGLTQEISRGYQKPEPQRSGCRESGPTPSGAGKLCGCFSAPKGSLEQ